jgi:hypothetical protein
VFRHRCVAASSNCRLSVAHLPSAVVASAQRCCGIVNFVSDATEHVLAAASMDAECQSGQDGLAMTNLWTAESLSGRSLSRHRGGRRSCDSIHVGAQRVSDSARAPLESRAAAGEPEEFMS